MKRLGDLLERGLALVAHPMHRYKLILETPNLRYEECRVCHERIVLKRRYMGYEMPDRAWLAGGLEPPKPACTIVVKITEQNAALIDRWVKTVNAEIDQRQGVVRGEMCVVGGGTYVNVARPPSFGHNNDFAQWWAELQRLARDVMGWDEQKIAGLMPSAWYDDFTRGTSAYKALHLRECD